MCGIFLVIPKHNKPININKCKKSLLKLKQRGPDYSFYKIINNIFFGQTILSLTGNNKPKIQNHYSNSKNSLILFNGEIYNYKLLAKKYNFEMNEKITDTEILINLFEKKKSNFLNELDGMYAFVAYDQIKKKIFIARDPQGEKSLFLFQNDNYIILSSEVNPIIEFLNNLSLEDEILKTYFYTRHFMQFEKTIYKNLSNIEQGQLIEINTLNYKTKKIEEFSLQELIKEQDYNFYNRQKENDLVNELDFLIKKNLKEMVPSKRNFATIVSGGVDSTLVSLYLNKISDPKYLISLNHIGKDKISDNIKIFQKYFNKKIYDIPVNESFYKKNYLKALNICQSPINSHDFVGKLIIAEKVKKKKCKVVFGGDGADEIFGGYPTYNQKLKNLSSNNSDYSRIIKDKIVINNKGFKYFKSKILTNWQKCLDSYNFIKSKDERIRQSMILMDLATQLSSVGLRGSDLMSMNYSVEPRSIFLRKDILKFGLNLPIKFKINPNTNQNKIILKKVFLKYFSKELLYPKQGFAGFPNEMKKYLPSFDRYLIKKKKKFLNQNLKYKKLSRSMEWKICNTEFFLRSKN